MPVATLTLSLHIEHSRSLKDRRQVLRSLKDRIRHGFNVSVAELDDVPLHQSATLGIAAISLSRDYLMGLMQQLEEAANRMALDLGAEITDSFAELVN